MVSRVPQNGFIHTPAWLRQAGGWSGFQAAARPISLRIERAAQMKSRAPSVVMAAAESSEHCLPSASKSH